MLKIPEFLKGLRGEKAAVFGGGVSGRGVGELLEKLGWEWELFDVKAEGAKREFSEADARRRLVVFSPGFSPEHEWLKRAEKGGCVCLGELDFGALFWRGTIVAVTGTNGKTTLTEFLAHALRMAGKDAMVAGNIGVPLTRLAAEREGGGPDSVAVCEVSSFQSEVLRHFRADSAIWTNFAEDHLERHPSLEAYFLAKWRLFERAVGGEIFAGTSVAEFAEKFGQTLPEDARVETLGVMGDVLLGGTVFERYPQRENFILAAAWWRRSGLKEEILYAAARSFKLSGHRLALVDRVNGVEWWNDSKATNFHAVEAAVSGFNSPVILIAGGKSKGGDFLGFARRLKPFVKRVLLIGATGEELGKCLEAVEVPSEWCGDLKTAVRRGAEIAVGGDVVILGPAFASFDQFSGYDDRGKQFIALVNDLKRGIVSGGSNFS